MHDIKNYAIHIRTLQQAVDHGLILEKLYRLMEFT